MSGDSLNQYLLEHERGAYLDFPDDDAYGGREALKVDGYGIFYIDNSVDPALLKDAAKQIAGLDDKRIIRQRLVYKLMRDATDRAISRYFQCEGIPWDYRSIVESADCLETLIKGIFYKVCKIRRSEMLDEEVVALCEMHRRNDSLSIVYERVGQIQKFIHEKVDQFCGNGARDALPVKHMRNLLAAARLHLHICDINTKDASYSVYLDELSKLVSEFEYFNPHIPELPAGKQVIPRWRVRHMKPLSHFYDKSTRRKLAELQALDEGLTADAFARAALEICAKK
ncbi:hypothetical protein LMG23992_00378 [Cupriavidus laharis]|uniref:DUF3800 domain-containing protein n=1 Tax=Cupriavidus laharis TaxID=151654 RepID=A0ABM8WD47_9BURK|nr:hypothetical protein [Cupriavidus laharis]CAG9165234.1 hypothetical protein LMG23992_00378 [Cupriavidus laharis]